MRSVITTEQSYIHDHTDYKPLEVITVVGCARYRRGSSWPSSMAEMAALHLNVGIGDTLPCRGPSCNQGSHD